MLRAAVGPPAGLGFFFGHRVSGTPAAQPGEARKLADPVAKVVLVFCASGSVRGDVAVFWIYHPLDRDVFPKARVERALGGTGPLWRGRRGVLRVGLSHVRHGDESLCAIGFCCARVVAGSSRSIPASQLAGDVVERAAAIDHIDAVRDRIYLSVRGGRIIRPVSGASRYGNGIGQRRLCHRALSPGDGGGGNVCDSGRAVFLVPENVRLPAE